MTDQKHILHFDEKVVDQLACPACAGDLVPASEHIVCTACGRAYPVIDGIPLLIPDRAERIPPQQ